VFVRGYGLVDSAPVQAKPGVADLNLTATLAKTPQEAARVYPGDYWLSLLDKGFLDSFLFSLKVGVGSAFGTLLFSYPLALFLRKPQAARQAKMEDLH